MCCKTLNKYLNENLKIHVIYGFCYKIKSFHDLSKLHTIALESSRSNPQHIERNFVLFSHKVVHLYSCTQSCNDNKLTPKCFLFVCFVALRPKSTAMVIAGWSVHLTTLFPGQA